MTIQTETEKALLRKLHRATHTKRWRDDMKAAYLRAKQRDIVSRMEALRKEREAA